MDDFSERSSQSLNSAQCLIGNAFYPSTLNRAYYAALQYILYILMDKQNVSRNSIFSREENEGKGSHVRAYNLICEQLEHKHWGDYKGFQRTFLELKKSRNSADYFSNLIKREDCINSIKKANSIIEILKRHF